MRAIVLSAALLCGCSGATSSNFTADSSTPIFNVCSVASDGGTDGGVSSINVQAQTISPWLLTVPKIHVIFWGSFWNNAGATQFQQLTQEFNTILNDPNFYTSVSVYGIKPGSLDGIFNTNPNVPAGVLSEPYITQELQNEINSGVVPSNDANSLYVIILPQGTQAQLDIQDKFAGRHDVVNNIAYTYVEYSENYQDMGAVVSHEAFESFTDPNGGTGFNGGVGGEDEIADYCQNGPTWQLDGYPIAKVWDANKCNCVP